MEKSMIEKDNKKPCTECGKECDIYLLLLPLYYLRICDSKCMFIIAYRFLREISMEQQFLNKLEELQNEEDKKLRDNWVKEDSMNCEICGEPIHVP